MKKRLALIPPSGYDVYQDGFFNRFIKYIQTISSIDLYYISLKSNTNIDTPKCDYNIILQDYDSLVIYLKKEKFNLILHRSWMHRYKFAGNLCKDVDNVIIYIKDWMPEIPRDQYKFLYVTDSDYDGIRDCFKYSKLVLSHYDKDYRNHLSKIYNEPYNKLIFFPEYCNKDNFIIRTKIKYKKNCKKNIVMAGGFVTTTGPRQLCENKNEFEVMKKITSNENINLDFFILENKFNEVFNSKNKSIWQDWLYEHQFNKQFSIKLGSRTNMKLFKKYDFAIATGLKYDKETYYYENYAHAVVSKMAFYLELGIPLLVHKKWYAMAKIVKDNNIGILISNKDIYNLDNILNISKNNYVQMVTNIYKFRKDYTYNYKTMNVILE